MLRYFGERMPSYTQHRYLSKHAYRFEWHGVFDAFSSAMQWNGTLQTEICIDHRLVHRYAKTFSQANM